MHGANFEEKHRPVHKYAVQIPSVQTQFHLKSTHVLNAVKVVPFLKSFRILFSKITYLGHLGIIYYTEFNYCFHVRELRFVLTREKKNMKSTVIKSNKVPIK